MTEAERNYSYALHRLTLAESSYFDGQKIMYDAQEKIHYWSTQLQCAENELRELGITPPEM